MKSLMSRLQRDVPYPVIVAAAWSLCIILIAGGVLVAGRIIGKITMVLIPLAIALLIVAKKKSGRSADDTPSDARAYATDQRIPQKQTRRSHQRDGEVSVPRAAQPRHQADESDAPRGKHTRR